MQLQAIYSSKLYKSSKRKSKIDAALVDPINSELVKQLSEYLDEEYVPDADSIDTKTVSNPDEPDKVDETVDDNSSSDDLLNESDSDNDLDDGTSNDDNKTNNDTTSSDDLASSATLQYTSSVFGSIDNKLSGGLQDSLVDVSGLANELKGTLNMRNSTCGVSRSLVKNDEVWIYYNDDINLNNVMTDVIELLNASNYQYLTFNRLARTDNAIVFTISINDTDNSVKSTRISNE